MIVKIKEETKHTTKGVGDWVTIDWKMYGDIRQIDYSTSGLCVSIKAIDRMGIVYNLCAPKEAYILNDNGKTVEKLICYNALDSDDIKATIKDNNKED